MLCKGEEIICISCQFHLPKTNFHENDDNPLIKKFWGKVNVASAAAFYFFNKGDKVQRLIHRLKYKGDREIGIRLGSLYGNELNKTERFRSIDLIVPVPLHPNRIRKRGYNQSALIAEGMKLSMNKKVDVHFLQRNQITETQTRKNRWERFKNVNNIFSINPDREIKPMHFLLIDDVITTGSTLTSCAETLLKIPSAKVSVAALAFAYH